MVTSQPAAVTAGQSFSLSVAAEDQNGDIDPFYNGKLTIGLTNSGGATLGGNTNVTMIGGVAPSMG